MRLRTTVLGLILLSIIALSVVAACGSASGEPTEQPGPVAGETLLQERCTQCHGLDRVTEAEKTREEWADTVARMVDQGARLDQDEQSVLVDYLAQTYGP